MSYEAVVRRALDFHYTELSDALIPFVYLGDHNVRFGITVEFSLREGITGGVVVKDFSMLCSSLYSLFSWFFDADLGDIIQWVARLPPLLSVLASARFELGV